MANLSQALNRLKNAVAGCQRAEGRAGLYATAQLNQQEAERILMLAAKDLVAPVRAELAKSYAESGIPTKTGTLEKAAVAGATISPTRRGVIVRMQSGVSYPNGKGNVYGAAACFRYGGNPGRPKTGQKKKKKQKSKIEASKRNIKPKPPFFQLTGAGVMSLSVSMRDAIKRGLKAMGIDC